MTFTPQDTEGGREGTPTPIELERRQAAELHQQLRDVNERLVLATLRAHELVEEGEKVRALVALSELRLRSLVNDISAIVWTASPSGDIRFDSRWHVLTGLPAHVLPDRWDWLVAVHPGDRERVRAAWAKAIESGASYECEHRLLLHGGGTAWMQAHAVPILDSEGVVREWTGLMDDITDRKLVEEARDRFVGVLGHDLRTPLSAIKLAAVTLLDSEGVTERQQRSAHLIGRCADRMGRMIADVLDFARGRLGGGIPMALEPADLGEVCHGAIAELQVVHPTRRIVFETSGDLAGVWDVDRVQQAISNLVGNALEHGGDPVRVTLRGEANEVVITIQNPNLERPIAAEILPLLFEPFRRGGDRSDVHGLGLGLYIVSEIVHAHGGTIVATSSAEGGTSFVSRWSRRPPGLELIAANPRTRD